MARIAAFITLLLFAALSLFSQTLTPPLPWQISKDGGITRAFQDDDNLPHADHMAMSGFNVDMILEWEIDSSRVFHAVRVIRWPMLRTIPDDTHASLQRKLNDIDDPVPMINGKPLTPGTVKHAMIHGMLAITSIHTPDIVMTRTIFPSTHCPAVIDMCRLENTGSRPVSIKIPAWRVRENTDPENGLFGVYSIDQFCIGEGSYMVPPGSEITYAVIRAARKHTDAPYFCNPAAELAARNEFIAEIESQLVLQTPDEILNRLFAFSKLRASESIFSTRGGLMHGPGGYNKYLAAIWANDQAEYVNPFFPFLGNSAANESAVNSYRLFAGKINPRYNPIPSSIVAEGRDIWNGAGDRGDAAMIAYGAARFCLASGNPAWGRELWPLIQWCLEYCRRNTNNAGVIASDTDELEGRFPAGTANLCTSSLYYDALISSSHLANALSLDRKIANNYNKEAAAVRNAMKNYFEAVVEGFETYQYYQGNTVLRSWICIPLTVGIHDRYEGTVDALFSSRLWTDNGLLTKAGTHTVWDRSTLYAFRGIMSGPAVDRALEKLTAFSRQRLLGDHVPYVIEAYPEYNGSHLSAESGLYCRIFTESLFGIRPTGFKSFTCAPRLPETWDTMSLKNIHAFGTTWNMDLSRMNGNIRVIVTYEHGQPVYDKSLPAGKTHYIALY